ncbi:hypothetical protein QOT17_003653 [Balamuthia mandrillaris]
MNREARGVKVEGSDGSDGRYRMQVEQRYEVLAKLRQRFANVCRWQAIYCLVFVLLIAVNVALNLTANQPPKQEQQQQQQEDSFSTFVSLYEVLLLSTAAFYGCTIPLGQRAFKKSSPSMLRLYTLLSTAALLLTNFLGVILLFAHDWSPFLGRALRQSRILENHGLWVALLVVSVAGCLLSLMASVLARTLAQTLHASAAHKTKRG